MSVGGRRIALISDRTQALGLELFRNLGIEPADQKLVVGNSANHFLAELGPIARKVICVDAGSRCGGTIAAFRIARAPRPIWPLNKITMTKPRL